MRRRQERLILSAVLLSNALVLSVPEATARARGQEPATTEGQPLAANAERVVRAMESLGAPLPAETAAELAKAGGQRDVRRLQDRLDPHVLLTVTVNPE